MPNSSSYTPGPDQTRFYFRILKKRQHPSYVALPRTLEEEADNKHLQSSHGHDHQNLDDAEVDDSLFCAADGAEVAVLTGAEVFLVAGDGGQLARELEQGLLEG